jgi:hypothetical protein
MPAAPGPETRLVERGQHFDRPIELVPSQHDRRNVEEVRRFARDRSEDLGGGGTLCDEPRNTSKCGLRAGEWAVPRPDLGGRRVCHDTPISTRDTMRVQGRGSGVS